MKFSYSIIFLIILNFEVVYRRAKIVIYRSGVKKFMLYVTLYYDIHTVKKAIKFNKTWQRRVTRARDSILNWHRKRKWELFCALLPSVNEDLTHFRGSLKHLWILTLLPLPVLVGLSSSNDMPPPDLIGSPRAVSASLRVCITFSMIQPGRISLALGFLAAFAFLARFLNAWNKTKIFFFFNKKLFVLENKKEKKFFVWNSPWIYYNIKKPLLCMECRKTIGKSK